jgi:Uma2 family endonuclease
MMATAATPKASPTGVVFYRLSVDQFLKMIDAGIFPERARVELVGGMLVERMVKHEPHNYAVSQLADLLRPMIAPGWSAREEKPIRIGRWSRPEPDLALVRGRHQDHLPNGPSAPDTALVIEVADATYAKDRNRLWRLYAAGGIARYWIVNIPDRRIEVYSDPTGRGRSARYQAAEVYYGEGTEVPVCLDGREVGRIVVTDVLP